MKVLISLFLLSASSLVNSMSMPGLFIDTKNTKNEAWNDLKVTWGINPFSSENFVAMPRTETEARAKGWTKEKSCPEVRGNRYMFMGDTANLLIFDANGDIAGIASTLPKGLPFNFPSKQIQKIFKDEGNSWTINAYFTDPAKVCSPTQTRKPTGDRLVIDGTDYQLVIPMSEAEMTPFWTLGQCFRTMGVHYWADLTGKLGKNADPDNFVPLFLQYNKGKLNGFGWAFNADVTSNRFEHPVYSVLGSFFREVPDFMGDPTKVGVLSTLHIYMDSTPQLNFC